MGVEFYSEMDKAKGPTGNGQVASSLPAWYFQKQIRDLEDDIRQTQRRLEMGQVPHNKEGDVKSQLRKMEKKLDGLKNSNPKNDPETLDACSKAYKDLSKVLSSIMPSYNDDKRGRVNLSKQVDMQQTPSIVVPDYVAQMAVDNGFPITKDRKMRSTDVSLIWKMCGRMTDQETNTEVLRREK